MCLAVVFCICSRSYLQDQFLVFDDSDIRHDGVESMGAKLRNKLLMANVELLLASPNSNTRQHAALAF